MVETTLAKIKFPRIRRFFPFTILAILGPGLIATAAGNDAGGIATYASAGAHFGLSVLWIMTFLTVGFVLIQEMAARLGAATGKGFSDLIRENFSLRMTVFMMSLLLLGNIGLVVSEFAGIAASLELLGITKYISVPVGAVVIWFLIVKGNYPKVEKIFLLMSGFLLSYIFAAILAKPDWNSVAINLIRPSVSPDPEFFLFTVALIGTTIAPFMQVFAQSAVVEKGITMSDFKYTRIDTLIGTLFANLVAIFIIIATASTLFPAGIRIDTAADAATALVPFAGEFARILFALGLLGASLLAAGVVPLTTSFALANAFGWEAGINRSFEEAPIFYAMFTFIIVLSATIVLSPALSLIKLLVGLQVVNGLLLPIQLYFMLKLANNKNLMGKHVNPVWFNSIVIITMIVVTVAVFLFLGSSIVTLFQSYSGIN